MLEDVWKEQEIKQIENIQNGKNDGSESVNVEIWEVLPFGIACREIVSQTPGENSSAPGESENRG